VKSPRNVPPAVRRLIGSAPSDPRAYRPSTVERQVEAARAAGFIGVQWPDVPWPTTFTRLWSKLDAMGKPRDVVIPCDERVEEPPPGHVRWLYHFLPGVRPQDLEMACEGGFLPGFDGLVDSKRAASAAKGE